MLIAFSSGVQTMDFPDFKILRSSSILFSQLCILHKYLLHLVFVSPNTHYEHLDSLQLCTVFAIRSINSLTVISFIPRSSDASQKAKSDLALAA